MITPATLSVRTGIITNTTSTTVPCPDYSSDSDIYWANFEGVGNLDGPSPAVTRLVAATMASLSIVPFTAPFLNSSYALTFNGPALRCQDLAEAAADEAVLNSRSSSGFNITTTTTTDAAAADATAVPTLQNVWNQTMSPLFEKDGVYEPIYTAASYEMDDLLLFVNTNYANGDMSRNYSCSLWNTSYTVDFDFFNGTQSTNIRDLQYVSPVQTGGTDLYTKLAPEQVQYRVFFQALASSLATQLYWGSTGSLVGQNSAVLTSAVAACPEVRGELQTFAKLFSGWMCRAGSVPAAIEDLSHNVTLSLLSSEFLSNETFADVTTHRSATFYTYNWRNLVMAYAISVAAALICAAVGVQALVVNGYSASVAFSTILLTTRNEELDYVARSHCLGQKPMDRSLGQTMLLYGILKSQTADGSRVPHAAFGLSSDVRMLERGEPCQ